MPMKVKPNYETPTVSKLDDEESVFGGESAGTKCDPNGSGAEGCIENGNNAFACAVDGMGAEFEANPVNGNRNNDLR